MMSLGGNRSENFLREHLKHTLFPLRMQHYFYKMELKMNGNLRYRKNVKNMV
jgi:hypothetical protein